MNEPFVELLAPAGNLEKLKTAIAFGADAVYCGVPDFSLRSRTNQFDFNSLKEGVNFSHAHGKKIYFTFNIYAHNFHFSKLISTLEKVKELQPDALIISDPGVLSVAKKILPKMPLHLSTQANATNSSAVEFWNKQGIERVILAREVTLKEIKEIHQAVPKVALEIFVHGAMCMAYSGRCILSKWMTGRSANLGDCAQPCRWSYQALNTLKSNEQNFKNEDSQTKSLQITDQLKRFEIEVEEDKNGTYFFNSFDLCLIEHLKEIIEAGVVSLKIEGRNKSIYYVAVVTRAYRKVLDAVKAFSKGQIEEIDLKKTVAFELLELAKVSHRGYSKGFLLGDEPAHLFSQDALKTNWTFVGFSQATKESSQQSIYVHNFIQKGDYVEIISFDEIISCQVVSIFDEQGLEKESAHGGQGLIYQIVFNRKIKGGQILIRKNNSKQQ